MIIEKILGGISILAGFFFIFFFSDWATPLQSASFIKTAIIIGIFLLLLGIYLIRM